MRAGRFPHALSHSMCCSSKSFKHSVSLQGHRCCWGAPAWDPKSLWVLWYPPKRGYRKSSNDNSKEHILKKCVCECVSRLLRNSIISSHAQLIDCLHAWHRLEWHLMKAYTSPVSLQVFHWNKSVSLLQLAQMIFPPKHLRNNKHSSGQKKNTSLTFYLNVYRLPDRRISDRK